MNTETSDTAATFADARKKAIGIEAYPGTIPASLSVAYRIQDQIIARMAGTIGGWKVGRISGPQVEQLGANRLAGPIFSDHIFGATSDKLIETPVYAAGYAAAEAEFMLRIGQVPNPKKLTYTLDEAAAMIDQICVGIEMASSPFTGINDNGAATTASDLGNSKALVIGAAISSAEHMNYKDWPITLSIDGIVQGEAAARGLEDGPVGAVRFLLELLAARGIQLQTGQWVSTGAITGVHQVYVGQSVEARFGDSYTVRCKAKAALPV